MLLPDFQAHIDYIISAHRDLSRTPGDQVRRHDKRTPYSVHPLWCATTLLTEVKLPEPFRVDGALALLYHDVLEDTTAGLPSTLSPRVIGLIEHMTFLGGSAQEMKEVWQKPPEVRLLKAYDKVSNLLDGSWMSPEKRVLYGNYTGRLLADVRTNFGELNIVVIGEAVVGDLDG